MAGVSLRTYLDRSLHDYREGHRDRHALEEKTREMTYAEFQRRMEMLNELREEVTKDRNQFLRLDVYDEKHLALMDRVNSTEDRLVKVEDWLERGIEEASTRKRQRLWLIGLTVTTIVALVAIAANMVINLTQGVP